jgi:hypothetical protein
MTEQIEKDIVDMKTDLAAIKKALGIGTTAPCNIIDIWRRQEGSGTRKEGSKDQEADNASPAAPFLRNALARTRARYPVYPGASWSL